jgi:hypothetical protein
MGTRISAAMILVIVSPATDPKVLHSRTFQNMKVGDPLQEKSDTDMKQAYQPRRATTNINAPPACFQKN